jgi:hypothetical protein
MAWIYVFAFDGTLALVGENQTILIMFWMIFLAT